MTDYATEDLFPEAMRRSFSSAEDPLTDEEFMTIIDEGRRRLGGMALSFENCLRQWHRGERCPVCARHQDSRCMEEC